MNLLLDTHAFLWWVDGVSLPPVALDAVRDPSNTVWLSAASVWEITIKASLGKLKLPDRAVRFVEHHRKLNRFSWLPVEPEALDILQDLPLHHRDPFDRLLIAQAISLQHTLISADNVFANYSVPRIWS